MMQELLLGIDLHPHECSYYTTYPLNTKLELHNYNNEMILFMGPMDQQINNSH